MQADTPPPHRVVWDALITLVVIALDVPASEVCAPTRGRARAALARHIATYLAVTTLGWTASDAARTCGRDRASVRHALARIEDRRDCPAFDAMITALEEATLSITGVAGVANQVPGLPLLERRRAQKHRTSSTPLARP